MFNYQVFLLLNFISIASGAATVITPALPVIETCYRLGVGEVEWMVSIFLAGYMIGQMIYGALANSIGRITSIRLGLCVNLFGLLLCLSAFWLNLYSLLILGRLVTALGTACGLVCSFIIINEKFSATEARYVTSYATLSFTLSIALFVSIGGLITECLGWQYCFVAMAIHSIVLIFASYGIEETLQVKQHCGLKLSKIYHDYKKALSNKKLCGLSLMVSMNSVFAYAYASSAPLITYYQFHMSPSSYGMWNIISIAGMATGGFLSIHLIKKMDVMRIIILGMLFMLLGFFLLVVSLFVFNQYEWLFFVANALMFLAGALIYPQASTYAINSIADKGSSSGSMSFINIAGAVLAVVALGYLPFDHGKSLICLLTIALIFFSYVLLKLLYDKNWQ